MTLSTPKQLGILVVVAVVAFLAGKYTTHPTKETTQQSTTSDTTVAAHSATQNNVASTTTTDRKTSSRVAPAAPPLVISCAGLEQVMCPACPVVIETFTDEHIVHGVIDHSTNTTDVLVHSVAVEEKKTTTEYAPPSMALGLSAGVDKLKFSKPDFYIGSIDKRIFGTVWATAGIKVDNTFNVRDAQYFVGVKLEF